jgi:hypothetical protein
MKNLTFAVVIALIVAGATALDVLAHGGGEAFIHVPADHIEPGEPFPVVAADLGENAVVALTLATGGRVVPLGTATAGPDGHLEATAVLPASVGDGYAELIAEGSDGSRASTWVRVGTGGHAGLMPPRGNILDWVDPSLVVVAAGLAVLVAILLVRAKLRRRRRPAVP